MSAFPTRAPRGKYSFSSKAPPRFCTTKVTKQDNATRTKNGIFSRTRRKSVERRVWSVKGSRLLAASNPAATSRTATSPASACSSSPTRTSTGTGNRSFDLLLLLAFCFLPATRHVAGVSQQREQTEETAEHLPSFSHDQTSSPPRGGFGSGRWSAHVTPHGHCSTPASRELQHSLCLACRAAGGQAWSHWR